MRTCLVLSTLLLVAAALPCGAEPVASAWLKAPDGAARQNVPVTFAQPFVRGVVTDTLAVRVNGTAIPAQVDAKRHYEDGSVRHAIVSAIVPELPAGGEMEVDLEPADAQPAGGDGVDLEPLLAAGFEATVSFRLADGTQRSASARDMLAKTPQARRWLDGPVCTEVLLEGAPLDADGEPDPYLRVQFHLRAYRGTRGVRVSCVVENCLDVGAGDRDIVYDVTITSGRGQASEVVYEKRDVRHYYLARWRKVFWWGDEPPPVDIRHDLASLIRSGAVPRYDTGLELDPGFHDRVWERWQQAPKDILENGSIMKYFPTTGGRDDIGPYPAWAARYLVSMDPRMKAICLGNGDLAGSFSYHVRNSKTGRLLTLDERPEFWLDERGRDKLAGKHNSPYTVDTAHQPSLAYVPYLVTGDYYYLEEMYFWAGGCLLSQWFVPRENEKGLLKGDQVRGQAWAFRQIVDAASYGVDGDPEVAYFDEKVRNNIAYWTHWATRPEASPFGTYNEHSYPAHRVGHEGKLAVAPWQHDFVVWAMDHAVDQGYAEAAVFRDYLLKFTVGRFTNGPDYDPVDGAPYFIIVGEKGPPPRLYGSWKEMWEATFGDREDAPTAERRFGSYGAISRMALTIAVRAGIPKAQEALDFVEAHLPDRGGYGSDFERDPTWALVP
ncbi:MAG: hypothetical protein ACE5R4_14845 [Armatimonadota bacterium]